MKNEEAIEILKQFKKCLSDVVFDEKGSEAWQMAIKALEQQPKILDTIDFAIDASNGDTNYFVGFRNGLRYAKSLIDGEEPQYESCADQQPCDDAISCEAVIEWLKAKDIIKLSSQEETARKELKALPPVTPQQKYGKWKVVSDGYGDNAYICECSECKDTVWVYKDADRKWNYCPSCGAKMVEPQESEDKE